MLLKVKLALLPFSISSIILGRDVMVHRVGTGRFSSSKMSCVCVGGRVSSSIKLLEQFKVLIRYTLSLWNRGVKYRV